MLSRALIDENLVGTGSVTLCYFFFKDNEEQNNTATALCALLHQFFLKNEHLFHKQIVSAIEKYGEALKGSFEELWRTFVSAATDPSAGNVVCILDALDECQEADRYKLITRLEDFYGRYIDEPKRQSKLKFLVTSRPYSDIEYGFSKLTRDVPTIRLAGEEESEKISQEIGIVIEAKVKEIAERCRLNDHLRSSLRTRLCEIPNRTYLWLHLTLDEIRSKILRGKTEKRLLAIIDTLSGTVEEAYEKILAACDQKEARRILQIIVAARRPLTVTEIDVALEIEPTFSSYNDIDRQFDDRKESIRENCGLFVSIVGSRIYLIHQTARKFLVQKDIGPDDSKRWKHSINLQEGNRMLAEKCVTYLLFRELQTDPSPTQARNSFLNRQPAVESDTQEHPFLDYSATHWVAHVQEVNISRNDWISRTVKLCDIRDGLSSTLFKIYSQSTYLCSSYGQGRTAMHWGVLLGLVNETRYLIGTSFDCDGSKAAIQEIVVDAVRNDKYGRELLELFLDQRGEEVEITEQVVEAAARNKSSGKEVMALLLDRRGDEVKITE